MLPTPCPPSRTRKSNMLAASLSLLAPLVLATASPDSGPTLRVTVDSSRREVVVTAGPFVIRHMPKNMDHGMMHEMEGTTTPLLRFDWPMEAWFRGFDIELADAQGRPLDSRLVHHLNVMNFNRRQLLYPAVERMVAAGSETGSVSVPKSIGIPMEGGLPARDVRGVEQHQRRRHRGSLADGPARLEPQEPGAPPRGHPAAVHGRELQPRHRLLRPARWEVVEVLRVHDAARRPRPGHRRARARLRGVRVAGGCGRAGRRSSC